MLEDLEEFVNLLTVIIVLFVLLGFFFVCATWNVEGAIVNKYVAQAYMMSQDGKMEKIPEVYMVKIQTSNTLAISSKGEVEVLKGMYEIAEIGDTYISDLRTGKKIVKDRLK
jgi:biopolymer transport protein ExbD